MKFTTATLSVAALLAAVSSVPVRRDVPENLVPQFGVQSGLNPTGTGDCDGINNAQGVPIKIPCACPPDRTSFIQELNSNVNAGHVLNNPTVLISFPTDGSQASQSARINAAAVTLQNLHGPGQGCPVAATTFQAQQAAINAGQDPNSVPTVPPAGAAAPAPAPAPPAPAPPAPPAPANNAGSSGALSEAQVAALAPQINFQAGLNPTGTGDCDGTVNGANGQPIKIPCTCPPTQDAFNQALTVNVNAGQAVNNPTVKITFPTTNSAADQIARLNAGLITLQNLNGPGVGCPAVSSTFQAQQKALQG